MSSERSKVCRAVPLPREVCTASPEELAACVAGRPGSFWLDTADSESGVGDWSYVGWQAERCVSWREGEGGDPLDRLRSEVGVRSAVRDVPADAPTFCGGWFALLAYDLGRSIENLPERAIGDLSFPELYLARHPVLLAFSRSQGRWWVAGTVAADASADGAALQLIACAERWLKGAPSGGGMQKTRRSSVSTAVGSNVTREAYEQAVRRALAYIAAGDIYQVNLSQRFAADWHASAFDLFRRLRQESPARYGVYARLDEARSVCSISPELFLRTQGRKVWTRPIKGTRRRGATAAEDEGLRRELARCTKELAELNMIVDLERNDLGRVCEFGSVRVDSDGEIEEHPTVFHRVASVSGRLRDHVDAADLLRATFPGGSITGAPKIRAMEIIEELEPARRGLYCGSLGWIGMDGNVELNIAIRTALVDEQAGKAWYHAGSGIVADSQPAHEYEETLHKAAAFLRAVNP